MKRWGWILGIILLILVAGIMIIPRVLFPEVEPMKVTGNFRKEIVDRVLTETDRMGIK